MYEIVNVQYTGTYNNGGTSIPAVLGEFRASSAADLPAQNVDCHIICGCDGLDIATGDRYIWDGTAWILQPSDRAFSNVYTKAEIDNMSNVIYQTMLYYHTAQESSDGSITFYTLGTPVSSLTIYGNGQQTGTPTPENPVMPEFVGVRTAQLFDESLLANNKQLDTTTGLPVSYSGRIASTDPVDVSQYSTVTISYVTTTTIKAIYSIFSNGELVGRFTAVSSGLAIDVSNADKMYICFYSTWGGNIDTSSVSDIMLNAGSTALPYEPFGWAEKITCAGQTVPVYLGQVSTVRRIKKLVLDGTGNWTENGTGTYKYFAIALSNTAIRVQDEKSTHFLYHTITESADTEIGFSIIASGLELRIRPENVSGMDATAFKAYLAAQYANGTPVTIWYVLATPETGIVNEPLAKIGEYADEMHITNADVSIPTVSGENTLTVDTTLPPSKIVISGE